MYIPPLKKDRQLKIVLWDTAIDSNYVRLSHAEVMRFPYKMETAVVQMVGGRIQRKVLPVYRCLIRDPVGKVRYFFALGLKEITGEMFCPLTGKQLCELFPGTRGFRESPGPRERARKCQRVGSKPERAAKGQREPGIERKRQREPKSARESRKEARESQIPPKDFPQVFNRGFS